MKLIKINDQIFIKYQPTLYYMTLSSPLTVVALMNGMIGGVILVLPVSSLQAGYIYTILAIIIAGAFSFYSCYLSIKHIGDQKDMNFSLLVHFNNYEIIKILYDIVVWLGLFFGSMFYYGLICIQWQSITGQKSVLIPILNAILLFFLIFILKYLDFGQSLMAYGIISIACYLIFLIWVIVTAPHQNISWKPFGSNLYTYGATMSLAYAIQAFFIPVLMKNPHKQKHIFITFLAYLIGGCIYIYICFIGSFGIISRQSLVQNPQTVQDYFKVGNVQLIIIECIYLIHLYSCLPEFVLISKKRLFNIIKIIETPQGKIPLKQIIYSAIFLGICLLIRLLGIKIDTIIAINGAIIGFFNIYLFPAILHIKCLYFSSNKILISRNNQDRKSKMQDEKQIQLGQTNNKINDLNLQKLEIKQSKELNKALLMNEDYDSKRDLKSDRLQIFESLTQQVNIKEKLSKNQNKGIVNQEDNLVNERETGQEIKRSSLVEQLQKREQEKYEQMQIKSRMNFPQVQRQKGNIHNEHFLCECQRPKSILMIIVDVFLVLILVGLGVAIMINGLIEVI